MTSGDLERALTLSRSSDGIWTARADPNYESANGMFGGWTTAATLRAVCEQADEETTPVVITINFVEQGGSGYRRAHPRPARRRWPFGELLASGSGRRPTSQETLAFASVVLAARRDTDGHLDIEMPAAPDPATLEATHPAPGGAGERTIVRPISGAAPHDRESTYSSGWVRETSGRPVDHLQLAFLADHREPRSFFWGESPRPSSTLSLSVYFHATPEELAAVGDDDVLSEAFATRGAQSTSEEHLRLWSRQGALLATSVQMDWYR